VTWPKPKFHPEFDAILEEILRRDPRGELVLIEGRVANWTRLLTNRFARAMPAVFQRIRWLPPLNHPDFLELLSLGDVVLDPMPLRRRQHDV
jgi:predicted O-linked N-acetylglucosamine transferase (SPINDLY family)